MSNSPFYDRIFRIIGGNESWDEVYNGLILYYSYNVQGDGPASLIGGNQFLVIQFIADVGLKFVGQICFSFNTNKIAYRKRSGESKWTSWQLI